jgi:hypothetical protein
MMTTLQQQLFSPVLKGFGYFGFVRIQVSDICLSMTRYPVEITEFTIGNTNIGSVHIPVNDPGYLSMWHLDFPEGIGYLHQFSQGSLVKQEDPFFFR